MKKSISCVVIIVTFCKYSYIIVIIHYNNSSGLVGHLKDVIILMITKSRGLIHFEIFLFKKVATIQVHKVSTKIK